MVKRMGLPAASGSFRKYGAEGREEVVGCDWDDSYEQGCLNTRHTTGRLLLHQNIVTFLTNWVCIILAGLSRVIYIFTNNNCNYTIAACRERKRLLEKYWLCPSFYTWEKRRLNMLFMLFYLLFAAFFAAVFHLFVFVWIFCFVSFVAFFFVLLYF